MSSVSEQDHLNPRDPLYYAPRSLRERSATRGASPETPFSAVTFGSQLESAVSDALRHPLDPELMHEPDLVRVHEAGIAHHVAAVRQIDRQNRSAAVLDR